AKTLLGNIKSKDVNGSNILTDGDFTQNNSSHPDYAAPDYYKVFATVSGDSSWNSVYTNEYGQLTGNQNGTTGLIPDAVGNGSFGYDACRAPWRVGLDYCWSASSSASGFLTKMVAYFISTSASGMTPQNIKIPVPVGGGTGQFNSGAITGPAAIAAMMSASNQTFVNNSYTYLYSLVNIATSAGNLNYFSATVGLISMLALSGNFVDYTNPPP
ncbi:MAG TPA: glycosyl hydrolase family 8, partial [Polyangiaceae bacterium]|nr:glycosyl hydrolase family 8 [Polyangiaceae bacterium]